MMRVFSAVAVAACVFPLAACDQTKQARQEAPLRPVLAVTVHYEPRERAQALPGTVKARTESDLAFRVGGRIEHRFVDAGAFVHKGEALATLDDSDFKLQLEQAEAEQASAQSALAEAEAQRKRITALSSQGWAANSEFDRIQSLADQARGAADKAARAVSLAKNAVSYATLTADADGVVSATLSEPGQVVAAGAAVVRLAHTDVKEASVAVPESLVDRVRAAKARVEFWALPGIVTPATLRELSPNADPTTRTYSARFSLPEAPAAARLGMSVTVTLAEGQPSVARVPIGAVIGAGDDAKVWRVDPSSGAVTATSVSVDSEDADSAYIAAGLPEGARIVALGVHKIDASQKVRIVDTLAGL